MLLVILDIFQHFKKCVKKLCPQVPAPGNKFSEPEPPQNMPAPKPCTLVPRFYINGNGLLTKLLIINYCEFL